MILNKNKAFSVQLISLICSIIIVSSVLYWFGSSFSNVDFLPDNYTELINEKYLEICIPYLKPEPIERFQFNIAVIAFPVLIFLLQYGLFIFSKRLDLKKRVWRIFSSLLWYIVFISSIILLFTIPFAYYLSPPGITQILIFCVCLLFLYIVSTTKNYYFQIFIKCVFYAVSIGLIILLGSFVIFKFDEISATPIFSNHLQPVLYPMVQVFSGKSLVVNSISQYGQFPHFIEPIFRLTGLSILSFTTVMAILLVISFFFIFLFIRNITKSIFIGFPGFLTVLYFCYIMVPKGSNYLYFDPYFQYYPIRFLFPSIFIIISYYYTKSENSILYILSFIIYSFAILWNIDTGLIVFITWLSLLIFMDFDLNNIKQTLFKLAKHLLSGIIILVTVFIIYSVYTFIRYGSLPDYSHLTYFQNIFYIYGFYMETIPCWHPWVIVALIYLGGLSYAVRCLLLKEKSLKANMVFMLSILGIGLFTYYQGRSFDACLKPISYPATIILVIFADSLYYSIKRIKVSLYTGGQFLLLLCLIWIFSLSISGIYYDYQKHNVVAEHQKVKKYRKDKIRERLKESAKFINRYTNKNENILIFANFSSALYLKTSLSPNYIDPVTIFTKKQLAEYKKLLNSRKIKKIFVNTDNAPDAFKTIESAINDNYRIVAKNKYYMYYLIPRKTNL